MRECLCGCGYEVSKGSKWRSGHNSNKRDNMYDWSNVEKDYEELGTLKAVANKYSCTLQAVHYKLQELGVDSSNEKVVINNIEEEYNKLKSVNKIAEKYNCSTTTVSKLLNEVNGFRFSHDNKMLENDVGVGRYGERIALNLLKGSVDMNEGNVHYPYDIQHKGEKIDVKTSRQRNNREKPYYTFMTNNNNCTQFFLVSLDEKDNPLRVMIIPQKDMRGRSVTYTEGKPSRWDKYLVDYTEEDLIKSVPKTNKRSL